MWLWSCSGLLCFHIRQAIPERRSSDPTQGFARPQPGATSELGICCIGIRCSHGSGLHRRQPPHIQADAQLQ
jgi:hypothetical protein